MIWLARITPHILLALLRLLRLRGAGLAWVAHRCLHGSRVEAAGAGVCGAAFVDLRAGGIGGGGGLGVGGVLGRGWGGAAGVGGETGGNWGLLEVVQWMWDGSNRGRTEGAGNGCGRDATGGRLGCAEELERHRRSIGWCWEFDDSSIDGWPCGWC